MRAEKRALHGVLFVWAAVDIHNGFHEHFRLPPGSFPSFLGPILDLSCGGNFLALELIILPMAIFLLPYCGLLLKTILSLLYDFLVHFD